MVTVSCSRFAFWQVRCEEGIWSWELQELRLSEICFWQVAIPDHLSHTVTCRTSILCSVYSFVHDYSSTCWEKFIVLFNVTLFWEEAEDPKQAQHRAQCRLEFLSWTVRSWPERTVDASWPSPSGTPVCFLIKINYSCVFFPHKSKILESLNWYHFIRHIVKFHNSLSFLAPLFIRWPFIHPRDCIVAGIPPLLQSKNSDWTSKRWWLIVWH